MNSKREEQPHQEQELPEELESLRRKLEAGMDQKMMVVPGDGVKMSEVLEQFIDPYLDLTETQEDVRKLVMVAVMAWNASLLPREQQADTVNDLLRTMPFEVQSGMRRLVRQMMGRKRREFAEYRRAIMDFEISMTRHGLHLSVASTPGNVPPEPT